MKPDKERGFPEDEAWAAGMPDAGQEFSERSRRKQTGSSAGPSGEYVHFAGLDLTNLGK